MKLILAIVISIFSISSFAGERSVSSTLSKVEFEKNVKCEFVKSSFAVCFGTPAQVQTCRYTSTYQCFGNENLTLKLKIKSFYNVRTNVRENVVTKIKIQ